MEVRGEGVRRGVKRVVGARLIFPTFICAFTLKFGKVTKKPTWKALLSFFRVFARFLVVRGNFGAGDGSRSRDPGEKKKRKRKKKKRGYHIMLRYAER